MKTIQILSVAVLAITVCFVVVVTAVRFSSTDEKLGNIFVNEDAYGSGVTFTSSTLTNNVATLLIPRATSSRTMARVCFTPGQGTIVWLFAQGTSTGVMVNEGTPIFATSSAMYGGIPGCKTYNASDPYFGGVYSITSATSSVTIEYKQE
jgi:hypothetical protein